MDKYLVTGMSCAACSARVEKAVRAVPGVSSCNVSLLTNSMAVEGTAPPEAVVRAVVAAGYGASPESAAPAEASHAAEEEMLRDRDTPALRQRLWWSIGFLAVLMYFSMFHMMWPETFPLPRWFMAPEPNHVAMGLAQLLLAGIVMAINRKFFVSGFHGLLRGAPNMDTLVALGAGASFVYSTAVLFAMTKAQVVGGAAGAEEWMGRCYFEGAAMILALITVGKMLEARSKGRTTDALKSLLRLAPKTATVVRDGVEVAVPVEQVRVGEEFVVRPGENIPVDGVVVEGEGAVNEAALTGESIPVDKAPGATVSAATQNQSGFLRCRATRVGRDTTLSQIIRMVGDAAATKAPIAKLADQVAGVFVPVVIGIALVTLAVWLLLGAPFGSALSRSIAVLVISCPCALGLATPVAMMVGSGLGARNGILFKTAASLEETGRIRIVALDKTGTITRGEPRVTDLAPAEGVAEDDLLALAYALERRSEHPLAKAVVAAAEARGLHCAEVEGFRAMPGAGLEARLGGEGIAGGSVSRIASRADMPAPLRRRAEALAEEGKTPLAFERAGKVAGLIAVADVIKPESPDAIRELREMGVRVVMLTGDNERTARAIGRQVGVDDVIAGVLPDGKEAAVRTLQEAGKVAMVGDGVNDAPALARADMGIAIGAGADVAVDAADIVLVQSRLTDVPAAIRLSRATLSNIRQNLFWAFFYNVVCIPLAAGCFTAWFGWQLSPMVAAAAMSLSSFCVVANALRLNLLRLHPEGPGPVSTTPQPQEEETMKKTLEIEGMMCGHCEARVKKALEAVDGVVSATASHTAGTAIVELAKDVADDVLRAAVEAEDYKVAAIR